MEGISDHEREEPHDERTTGESNQTTANFGIRNERCSPSAFYIIAPRLSETLAAKSQQNLTGYVGRKSGERNVWYTPRKCVNPWMLWSSSEQTWQCGSHPAPSFYVDGAAFPT